MNVFINQTILHSSLRRITANTFPLNYSIELTNSDFQRENAGGFSIVGMIWQPVYFHESQVKLAENKLDTLDLNMSSISEQHRLLFFSWSGGGLFRNCDDPR